MTFNGGVTLQSDTTLNDAGNVTFNSTLDADSTPRALTINTPSATIFNGAVGSINALASVTTDAPGSTQINGGSVTTIGAQTYNDAVTLNADTTLNSTNSDVTFGSTLDSSTSARSLTISTGSGDITFTGSVGSILPLNVMTLNSTGLITLLKYRHNSQPLHQW